MSERLERGYRRFGALVLSLLALGVMLCTLFWGDNIGLSDSGDFGRVFDTCALEGSSIPYCYQENYRMVLRGENFFSQAAHLLFSLEGVSHYPSIHLVFVRLSEVGNLALNYVTGADPAVYRVSVLGALYCLCMAALLFVLFRSFSLKRPGADLLIKGAAVLVLCDVGYVAYFNSLYSEPVQVLGLVAMAATGLRCLRLRDHPVREGVWFSLSCVLYGCSKLANLPAAGLCALCMAALLCLRGRGRGRWLPALGGGLAAALFLTVFLAVPGWMERITNYNAIFYGILKDVDEVRQEEYLQDLGLPEEMKVLAGTNYYTEQADLYKENAEWLAAVSEVSQFDLLGFYLSHPGRLLEEQTVAVAHSGAIRPFYLGNLGPQSPRLSFSSRFSLWSALRVRLPLDTWWFTGLLVLGGVLCLFLLLWRRERASFFLLAVAFLGALFYQFVIPIVTNGEGDLAKHMFAFVQLMDLLLLLLLGGLLHLCCRLRFPALTGAGVVAAALALALLTPVCAQWREEHRGHGGTLESGAYLSLGKTVWQVAEMSADRLTLLAADPVEERSFSQEGEFGSNFWETSDLRKWLNGEFLDRFSQEERALLLTGENPYVLAQGRRDAAVRGSRDFYCFHVPRFSDRGLESAWTGVTTDTVVLPDIGLIADLSRRGWQIAGDYWLETPYYSNSSMVRLAAEDGYLYMQDANTLHGVRPVVYVKSDIEVVSGSGSKNEPYVVRS